MVTKEDLQDFHRFAGQKLESGVASSLVDLAGEWESHRREMEETVADIRQSHADIEAGRVSSVSDAFADARRQLDQE
ncbi:MAG: hypothetical protein MI725_13190 [Pirellulales bacterium]|nr:hypothetical protein [Pirellulales bacterium]